MKNKLLVITGPTASGKTAEAIRLARVFGAEILSCDSRQFYREMRIGVARPTDEELEARRAKWVCPEPKVKTGYLARYAKLVSSADKGAILE